MTAAEYQQQYGSGKAKQAPVLPPSRPPQPLPALSVPPKEEKPADERKQASRRSPEQIAADRRDATLRPRYSVARYQGYEGKRMVLVGLSFEQEQQMRAAAHQAGIQEQQ